MALSECDVKVSQAAMIGALGRRAVYRYDELNRRMGGVLPVAAGIRRSMVGGRFALLSLPLLLGLSACLFQGCVSGPAPGTALERFEFSEPQMGVPFRIVLYAPTQATAEKAAKAAFGRISQLNGVMSDYEYDSELNTLSRTSGSGRTVPVSADLWRVLCSAQDMARRSDGAFDITVGPVVNLWRKARRDKAFPEAQRLERARQSVGYRYLQLDPGRRAASLLVPNMRLDLGGIAKGYALDEALAVLRSLGLRRALVTGGGDMAAGDPPPGKRGWRIEVAPLDVTNAPPARYLSLANAGLATSGDLFQFVEIDARRYSHIVDPRTGVGLTNRRLVTVIARTAMDADRLSTAVSVLGPQAGLALTRTEQGAGVYFLWKHADVLEARTSRGFERRLE